MVRPLPPSFFNVFVSDHLTSVIYTALSPVPECISGDNLSVSCPRLSPDGSTLIYLQGSVFGPHNQCLSVQQVRGVFELFCTSLCVFCPLTVEY